jgi:hypothetical protein
LNPISRQKPTRQDQRVSSVGLFSVAEDCGGPEGALGENEEGSEEESTGCYRSASREEYGYHWRSSKDCPRQENRLREKAAQPKISASISLTMQGRS